jgi:hypothetical protein
MCARRRQKRHGDFGLRKTNVNFDLLQILVNWKCLTCSRSTWSVSAISRIGRTITSVVCENDHERGGNYEEVELGILIPLGNYINCPNYAKALKRDCLAVDNGCGHLVCLRPFRFSARSRSEIPNCNWVNCKRRCILWRDSRRPNPLDRHTFHPMQHVLAWSLYISKVRLIDEAQSAKPSQPPLPSLIKFSSPRPRQSFWWFTLEPGKNRGLPMGKYVGPSMKLGNVN